MDKKDPAIKIGSSTITPFFSTRGPLIGVEVIFHKKGVLISADFVRAEFVSHLKHGVIIELADDTHLFIDRESKPKACKAIKKWLSI